MRKPKQIGLKVVGMIMFIALMLTFLTVFLGFYSLKASNKSVFRAVHRWSGRLSPIAILAALTLGLSMIGIF